MQLTLIPKHTAVEVFGLMNAKEHNGLCGEVLQQLGSEQTQRRCIVLLESGKKVKLKPESLKLPSQHTGAIAGAPAQTDAQAEQPMDYSSIPGLASMNKTQNITQY